MEGNPKNIYPPGFSKENNLLNTFSWSGRCSITKNAAITSYLFENRDKQEKIKLTRVIKKNKLDI